MFVTTSAHAITYEIEAYDSSAHAVWVPGIDQRNFERSRSVEVLTTSEEASLVRNPLRPAQRRNCQDTQDGKELLHTSG